MIGEPGEISDDRAPTISEAINEAAEAGRDQAEDAAEAIGDDGSNHLSFESRSQAIARRIEAARTHRLHL